MPHPEAQWPSSWRRKYDSGRPATPVVASRPHSSVLPVLGVEQMKYDHR
jgi:hypothetical protein